MAIGFLWWPYFEAREFVYRTLFHDRWLARNRRLEDEVGPLWEKFDKLAGGAPADEGWPDLFERMNDKRRRGAG